SGPASPVCFFPVPSSPPRCSAVEVTVDVRGFRARGVGFGVGVAVGVGLGRGCGPNKRWKKPGFFGAGVGVAAAGVTLARARETRFVDVADSPAALEAASAFGDGGGAALSCAWPASAPSVRAG